MIEHRVFHRLHQLHRFGQRRLGLLAQADVLDDRHEVLRRAVFVTHQLGPHVHPDHPAFAVAIALFDREAVLFARQRAVDLLLHQVEFLGQCQILELHAQQVGACIAGDLAQPVVDVQPAPVEAGFRQAHGGLLEGGAVARLALRQRLRGTAALGDVARDAEHPDHRALGVTQRPLGGQIHHHAVWCVEHFLEGFDPAAAHYLGVIGHQHRGLIGREQQAVIVAQHLVLVAAGQAHGLAVEQQIAALQVLGKDRVGRAVGNRRQQGECAQALVFLRLCAQFELQRLTFTQPERGDAPHEQRQQPRRTDPHGVLHRQLDQLGAVDARHQQPVGPRDRRDCPEDRLAAEIRCFDGSSPRSTCAASESDVAIGTGLRP